MFGPYRIDELLGRGGMGEVHQAYDTIRRRTVALKRLLPELADDDVYQARFRRESEIVAGLTEVHIIPIHDFGEIDGRLFIDMRLVDGYELASLLGRRGPLPADRAVNIVSQVADALAAAHAEDIVHRDVKPSNILITGGRDDFVYLTDFGIARSGKATSLTMTGSAVGTLDYMAPERFEGGPVDLRSDVYALGCVLYEALTSEKPFAVEGLAQVHAHTTTPPPVPSHRIPHLPRGLDAVVARAMAKDPDQRYPTALDLAAAARTALSSGDVVVAPPTVTSTSLAIGAMVSFRRVAAGGVAETQAPDHARPPSTRPGRRVGLAAGLLVAVTAAVAAAVTAAVWLTPERNAETAGPPAVTSVGAISGPRHTVAATVGVGDYPIGVATTADGRTVYVANSDAGSVSVLDTITNAVTATIRVGSGPFDVAVAPDGRHVYVSDFRDNSISVIDTAANSVAATLPAGPSPHGMAISPDGRRIYITVGGSDSVTVLDTTTRKNVATIPVGRFPISVAVGADGRRAYVTNFGDNSVSVIDTASNQVVASIPVGRSPSDSAISPDGRHLYVANNAASSVSVIDAVSNTVTGTIGLGANPDRMAITPDGRRVYALMPADGSSAIAVIDTASLDVTSFTAGPHPADVAIAADGRHGYVADNAANTLSVVAIDAG